jgi:hypothetical protein
MFDAPRPSETPVSSGDYIQPDFGHALRIWWALFWPTTLIGFVLGYGLTLGLKVLYEDNLVQARYLELPFRYGSYVVNYIVALFVMDYILNKKFRHFRIRLFTNWDEPNPHPLESTLARSARVWWTYVWRSFLYGIIGWLVIVLPITWFAGIFNPGAVVATLIFTLLNLLIGGGAALFAIYSNILDEDIGGFRVMLIPLEAKLAPSTAASDPTAG